MLIPCFVLLPGYFVVFTVFVGGLIVFRVLPYGVVLFYPTLILEVAVLVSVVHSNIGLFYLVHHPVV